MNMKTKFLMRCAGLLAVVAVSQRAWAQAAGDAKTLYDANCKKCHGVRGVPPKAMKTKFEKLVAFDEAFVAKHSVDSIAKVLVKGKGEDMKSFKDKMTAEQLTSVAQYVHELASKKAEP
jgi:mono/diheme cytochrome c family protein